MSTNFYHFLAKGEISPYLHVGKFWDAGRHCSMCDTYMGHETACPRCENNNEEEMKMLIGFMWAMPPSLFALHCVHGTVWISEYGEKLTSEELATRINEAFEQNYNSIGIDFN